jgi:hypothetical protein
LRKQRVQLHGNGESTGVAGIDGANFRLDVGHTVLVRGMTDLRAGFFGKHVVEVESFLAFGDEHVPPVLVELDSRLEGGETLRQV